MFKNKTTIPPRPKLPTLAQLLADLQNSGKDDIVFGRKKLTLDDVPNELEITNDSDAGSETIEDDVDSLYLRVKNFLETNNLLKDYVETLEKQHDSLEVATVELKKLEESIRKEAQKALK